MSRLTPLVLVLVLLAACGGAPAAAPATTGPARGDDMKISSPAFAEGAMIPARYACDAEDISPPLQWTAVPPETTTLALIAVDPDAPLGTWVHWVVFNLPAAMQGHVLAEATLLGRYRR